MKTGRDELLLVPKTHVRRGPEQQCGYGCKGNLLTDAR